MLGKNKQEKKVVREKIIDGARSEDLNTLFDIAEELGRGSFAIVRKGIEKGTGREVAIKDIDKANVGDEVQLLQTEVDILRDVEHPNIIKLFDVFEDRQHIKMVMELVTGGELFDRIVERGHYCEKDAAKCMQQLCSSLEYLHARSIVHRDLKPENLLCQSPHPDAPVKLADFGLSKIVGHDTTLKTACGTPSYVAPEVLNQKAGLTDGYSNAVDLWSAGVILYILLCGFPPFYAEDTRTLFDDIIAGRFEFPSPYWDKVSKEAKDLILHLLVVDPEGRHSAREVLQHPWITTHAGESELHGFQERLRAYNVRRKLKKAVVAVIAFNRFNSTTSNEE